MMDASTQTPSSAAIAGAGMVTSPHWLSARAGAKVLEAGGNAIEAIVAAGAALSVVYPHFCGLGGDAVWLVADRSGNTKAFLGIGQAARAATGDVASIPTRGPQSTLTTACLVDSWQQVLNYSAQNWQGQGSLAALLEDAIILADEGFPVSPSQAFWHRFRNGERDSWPGFAEAFVGQGIQRQPNLARTLRDIADQGARTFYDGDLARRLAAGFAAVGSPLTLEDLADTATQVEQPVALDYRDVTLFAPPPPTQGVTTLSIMGILARVGINKFDPRSADFYHHVVEAVKQAFMDRPAIADPASMQIDVAALLSAARLGEKAGAIDPRRALAWPQPLSRADTAFLAATDREGRSVAMLQSIYYDWGSGVVVGDTGILWQNRGAAFSLDPMSPNCLQAGKRPFYTLNPGIALKDGRPHLLYGTQGADGQPQTLALLLSLLLDHDFGPLEALSHPRFLLGRTFSDSRDSLKIEKNVGEDVAAALTSLGHEVAMIDVLSQLAGQAGVIRIRADGMIDGAHDPRSDGGAIGI
ncbi:gamma-glutamyltransferase [Rhizobium sp. Root708]|nr:gamma-glutamyltransferase [Rhizobium sp. Root708]